MTLLNTSLVRKISNMNRPQKDKIRNAKNKNYSEQWFWEMISQ